MVNLILKIVDNFLCISLLAVQLQARIILFLDIIPKYKYDLLQ